MDALKIPHANAMPAPTWGWLKMNDTTVEIPQGLENASARAVEVDLDGAAFAEPGAFERALDEAAARFGHLRRPHAPGDAADRARAAAHREEDGALDVPALSRYQTGAVDLEENYSPARAFETGMGQDAYSYLRDLAGETAVIEVAPGDEATVSVSVVGAQGGAAAASTDLIVRADARVALVLALDSPAGGTGVVGSALRVCAGPRARVDVTCVQTLGDGYTALDDSGFFLDESARVSVRHVVLGAGASYTGLAGDIAGDQARMDVDTSYLGLGAQVRDFNYELRHRGRRTVSNLDANGVLGGSARKVLRGTIDLVHGCKGSEGTEHETVLIADDGVDNKTIPVILCDEDDVAGNHGATIGHVRPDQLFYLQSRGVSPEQVEALFMRAKLEEAALTAPDGITCEAVLRLGDRLIEGFAAECREAAQILASDSEEDVA